MKNDITIKTSHCDVTMSLVKMVKTMLEMFRELYSMVLNNLSWIYEVSITLTILIPLCIQHLCVEPPLTWIQYVLAPLLGYMDFSVEPRCEFLGPYFKYRVYKYVVTRVMKLIWRFFLKKRTSWYRHNKLVFTAFLEFLSCLITLVLPLYKIYFCEEIQEGFPPKCLYYFGFVRRRRCPVLVVSDVIRRYFYFTLPRWCLRIFLWWRNRTQLTTQATED